MLGPITVNSKTFNQTQDGRYMISTYTFGSPANYITVKGGALTKDRKNIVCAFTRILEKDVTVAGVTTRRSASVQSIITVPTVGFTSAELDSMQSDNDALITAAILDRVLAGES
jgi:hypothetical protein